MSFKGWKCAKLGDIVEISSSKRIFAKEYTQKGIPFYRGKEVIEKSQDNKISNELFISVDRYTEIKEKFGVPKQGDILLTSVGTLGVPYLVQEEEFYFKDGNLTWFKNFSSQCDNKFIYLWLQSSFCRNQIYAKAIGSTQKALTIETLKNFELLLPPLEEQKAIADILSSLDDKIELNNQMNETLEEMAQALFKRWFIDFEFPNEEGQPYKSSGGEMVESELGMIPRGWNVLKLDDIGEVVAGGTPSTKCQEYYDGNISWITPKDLSGYNRKFIQKGERSITELGLQKSSAKMMPKGSVLFSSRAPIGYITIADNSLCTNQGFKSIVCNEKYMSKNYIYYLLKQEKDKIISIASGSTFKEVSGTTMKNYKIIVPHLSLLEKFENVVKTHDDILKKNYTENDLLTEIRDALLPKLMSGEICVSDLES